MMKLMEIMFTTCKTSSLLYHHTNSKDVHIEIAKILLINNKSAIPAIS